MRLLLVLFTALSFSFIVPSDTVTDLIGVKGPLNFNGKSFTLASAIVPQKNYYIQEYLPDGQKFETFDEMLSIFALRSDITPLEELKQKIKELEERKKTDPVCNYSLISNPDHNEYILDFLVGASKDDEMTVVELNMYRYKQQEAGKDGKVLVVYAYSKRSYGDNITAFLKSLKNTRNDYANAMIAADFPVTSFSK